jgi:hypothetical protein
MADLTKPLHGQTGSFFVNGGKRREGVLLLYPDKLAAVKLAAYGTWIYAGVPPVYIAVEFFVFHRTGWGLVVIWSLCGFGVWQALRRRLAARKVAAGSADVTAIPLDQVTSIRCPKPTKAARWLETQNIIVTTADGTEYRFCGLADKWHDHLASALTAQGREVHVAPESITVLPWATLGEG